MVVSRLAARLSMGLTLVCICTSGAFAQGRSGADTEEEQAFQGAEAAFKSNQDEEAARLYDKVIGLNPSRSDAYIKRAVIHYKLKQYKEAVALLEKGRTILPDDLGIEGQLGLSLYKAGDVARAVTLMDAVVQKKPDAYQVQLQLGQHYLKASDGKKAVASFEAYFRSRPEEAAIADAQIRPLAGAAYLITQQYPEAERELETALKSNPRDFSARLYLATAFTATDNCSKAITLYEQLLREVPREPVRQPSINYNLGKCYLKVNRRAEAERNADAYTKARAKDCKGWLLLGDARLPGRDYNGALAAFTEAQRCDVTNHVVEARLGKVYIAQKNYPAAVNVLESARKARPDDLDVLAQLAEVYAITKPGDHDLLSSLGEKLSHATDADGLTASGVAYFVAGLDALAEKSFTAAVAADGRAFRPRAGLQMTLNRSAAKLLAANDLPAAETLLVRAQKLDVESVQTNRNLGLVLLLEGRFADAEKALGLAHKKVARDLVVNRLLGRVYHAQGRATEALVAYQAAAEVAEKARGPILAQVNAEVGPLYADAGQLDKAVDLLETAVKEAGTSTALAPAERNLAIAQYRRGLVRLKDAKQTEAAIDDLTKSGAAAKGALAPKELAAVDCALAIATLKGGKVGPAQEALTRAGKAGGCTFAPPYDKVGLEFFTAYAQYRAATDPNKHDLAARAFAKLVARAPTLAETLRDLERSSYELEGFEWYGKSDQKKAAVALKSAAGVKGKGEHRSLDHNLAALDLNDGKIASAEKTFDALGQKPPEALANLGIVRDKQGDPKKALDLYRRAIDRGVRSPRVKEWIDVKERILTPPAASTGGGK